MKIRKPLFRPAAFCAFFLFLSPPLLLWAADTAPESKPAPTAPPARLERKLQTDEKIVFVGDSLTLQQFPEGGYVGLIIDAFRTNPANNAMSFRRVGISGAKIVDWPGGLLDQQALAHKPTLTVLYMGTADLLAKFVNKETPATPEQFKSAAEKLIDQVRKTKSRVILMTPAVLGENVDARRKTDQAIDAYCEILRKVATEKKVPLVDLRKIFTEKLKTLNPEKKAKSILTKDGVHTNPAGSELIARKLLDCMGKPDLKIQSWADKKLPVSQPPAPMTPPATPETKPSESPPETPRSRPADRPQTPEAAKPTRAAP